MALRMSGVMNFDPVVRRLQRVHVHQGHNCKVFLNTSKHCQGRQKRTRPRKAICVGLRERHPD